MFDPESSERLLSDGNATTAITGGDIIAPSAPSLVEDASPLAPPASTPTGENNASVFSPASAPTAEEPLPVFAPASAPISEDLSPIFVPESAPMAEGLSPAFAPASPPTSEALSPVSAPTTYPSRATDPPFYTPFGVGNTMSPPSSSSALQDIDSFVLNPFHIIVITCIIGIVTLLLFWKCCKSWKLRREKQMLRLQSTRVDAVLGDMQMVGMDEYDNDDPELI